MRRQTIIDGHLFDTEHAKHLASVFKGADGAFISPPYLVQPSSKEMELYRGEGGKYVLLTNLTSAAAEVSIDEAKSAFSVGEQHVSWQEAFPEDTALPLA